MTILAFRAVRRHQHQRFRSGLAASGDPERRRNVTPSESCSTFQPRQIALLDIPVLGFDPSTQTWTITLAQPLPAITGSVTIDGYSQGSSGVPFRYPDIILGRAEGPRGGCSRAAEYSRSAPTPRCLSERPARSPTTLARPGPGRTLGRSREWSGYPRRRSPDPQVSTL